MSAQSVLFFLLHFEVVWFSFISFIFQQSDQCDTASNPSTSPTETLSVRLCSIKYIFVKTSSDVGKREAQGQHFNHQITCLYFCPGIVCHNRVLFSRVSCHIHYMQHTSLHCKRLIPCQQIPLSNLFTLTGHELPVREGGEAAKVLLDLPSSASGARHNWQKCECLQ